MHKEDKLKELKDNPKLFHYIYGMPGEGFKKPNKLTNIDMIVPLNPQQAENLLQQPLDPLPSLPDQTRCIWIYETEPVNAITMMIQLNSRNIPLHFYKILTPVDGRMMKGLYEFPPPTCLQYAPSWLNRDYSQFARRIFGLQNPQL